MKLEQYPKAIAKLQKQILELEFSVAEAAESVRIFEAEIDKLIAFDSALKNDAQRKSKKIELQQTDPDFYQANCQLKKTKKTLQLATIELNLLQNEFSLLKLERREAIARIESQAS